MKFSLLRLTNFGNEKKIVLKTGGNIIRNNSDQTKEAILMNPQKMWLG